ncbi:MAG TPA: plastocyanin/azurin family copper-binding protein [Candidatus Paceibacterota bacterium]
MGKLIIVVIILAIVGGVYLWNKNNAVVFQGNFETVSSPSSDVNTTPPPAESPTPIPAPNQIPESAPSKNQTPATAPTPGATTHNVEIGNFSFKQPSINIKKGDAVVWTNGDSAPHTVTGDSGGPASPTIAKGETYSFTFTGAGTFNYHCAFHPSMKGAVMVTE